MSAARCSGIGMRYVTAPTGKKRPVPQRGAGPAGEPFRAGSVEEAGASGDLAPQGGLAQFVAGEHLEPLAAALGAELFLTGRDALPALPPAVLHAALPQADAEGGRPRL